MDRHLALFRGALLWVATFWLATVNGSQGPETTALVLSSTTTAPRISGKVNTVPVMTKPGPVTCLDECQCSFFGPSQDEKLRCESEDTMTSFPVLTKEHNMSRIREIVILNQPRLTKISSLTLVHYLSLEKLTIENSGLQHISLDTFRNNEELKSIILRGNKLTVVPWAILDGLEVSEMNIKDNPIECGCDVKWLLSPKDIFPTKVIQRPETCFYGKQRILIDQLTWQDCALPVVNVTKKYVRANISDRVKLVCQGRGSPAPRVHWMPSSWWKEGDYRVDLSEDEQTATLTISNATPKHSGANWCMAVNLVGRAEASATISVQSAPKILSLKEVQEAFHWLIPYAISGLPVPNVTWYRNSVPLSMNEFIYDKSTVDESFVSRKGYLTFTIANHLNNGNYTLVAENEYGRDTGTVYAVFLNSPDPFAIPPVGTDHTDYGKDQSTSETPNLVQIDLFPHRNSSQLEDKDDPTVVIVLGVVAFVFAAMLVGSICALVFHQRKRRSAFQNNRCFRSICSDRNRNSVYCDTIAREMIPLNSAHIVDNPNYFKQDPTIPQAKVVIPRIPWQNIQVLRDLGEGAFGRVVLGTCKLSGSDGDRLTLVAIKTLKESHAEDAKKDFDREAELLTSLQHENIVCLYGISEDGDTRMIIFEYMANGDLNNFLRSHGPDARFLGKGIQTTKPSLRMRDLLYISNQIAAGAEYLARNHFVHRDLATRNCLVGEKLTVKIGDFGMSRDVYSADYYKVGGQTMLPIRWMPYESIIYRTFTMESDVWSFGVVLWEIFSFGKQPWYELTNHEVIQHLEMGKVLDCPVGGHCPDEVYRLMLGCWRKHPEDRLSMSQLHVHLTRLLQYFSNDPAASTAQDYMAKHVSYLEILSDDAA